MLVSRVSVLRKQSNINLDRKARKTVTYSRGINRKPLSVRTSMVSLNNIVKDSNFQFVSHAIVNFSVMYFSMNWLYYRSIREKVEKARRDKDDKEK